MTRYPQHNRRVRVARDGTPLQAHMLVSRGIRNDELETRERMAVQAFEGGWATPYHYQCLADMQSVMILAGSTSETRKPAYDYAVNVIGPVLRKIAERYKQGKPLSVTTGERKVLREFATRYREFWLRQPTELYVAATTALQAHYDKVSKQLEAAA